MSSGFRYRFFYRFVNGDAMTYERANIRAMTGYAAGEQPDQARVIKLNTNENPYPASAAVTEALQSIRVEDLRRYPPPLADGFRRVAAAHHGVQTDNIMATNGGDELLRLAVTTFVEPGQAIGIAAPSYSLYPVLADIHAAGVFSVPLDADWTLPEDFADQLNAAQVPLAFVVNPHAPSGLLTSVAELDRLATRFRGVLLIDEAYADFVTPEQQYDALPLIRRHDNVLILRTLSKGYSLAGLRFAYGIAAASLLAPMLYKTRDSYNTDYVSQRLAAAAVGASAEAAESWRLVREQRQHLSQALTEMGFGCLPSEANFILSEVPDIGHERRLLAPWLYRQLKNHGILVRYFDQSRLQARLRITVGTAEQNAQLLGVMQQLLVQAQALSMLG